MFRLTVRQALVAAVVVVSSAAAPRGAAAQWFTTEGSTRYVFDGCSLHLCTTLTLYTKPASAFAIPTPGGAVQGVAWGATHTYLAAPDGNGVAWSGSASNAAYGFPGWLDNPYFDADLRTVGGTCFIGAFEFPQTSGGCVDPMAVHNGWLFTGVQPTGATITYLVGPAGQSLFRPGAQSTVEQLTLSLVSAGPADLVVTTPEPATLALVGGGLLALGGVARRRRRDR
jgi:hypothetical protein